MNAAGIDPKATGKNTLMLNNLCLIKRKLLTEDTIIFRINPIGLMDDIGDPIKAIIAI